MFSDLVSDDVAFQYRKQVAEDENAPPVLDADIKKKYKRKQE